MGEGHSPLKRRFAPPRPDDRDDYDWTLPTDDPAFDEAMSAEELAAWDALMEQPLIAHHPDTSLSHLYDTSLQERRTR